MSAVQQVPPDNPHRPEVLVDDSMYANWWSSMESDFSEVMDWISMGDVAGIGGVLG